MLLLRRSWKTVMHNCMAFMYFGDADDGSVKTGKQSIDIDGDKD